jgi:hypothetical protein
MSKRPGLLTAVCFISIILGSEFEKKCPTGHFSQTLR